MNMNLFRIGVMTLLLALATGAGADERILDYTIEVAIRADASLDVTEHITVRAEGRNIRRGIYRDFPTRYRDRRGNRVLVSLDVLGVERDGRPEPWFTENLSNGVRINTGNDDFLPVPADIRYTLRYRTTHQIGFFAEHDELYWNAIGTGWAFPVDVANVQVRLPEPVPLAQMSAEGYTGPQGANDQNYIANLLEPGLAHWRLTAPLAPQEGLTIVLTFPKGLLPEPSRAMRVGRLLRDNIGVLVALIGLFVLWFYCATRWWRIGRDPRAGVIVAHYDPPEGRSPAELRYLRRGCTYDMRCFTADLLLLAVDGCARLHRENELEAATGALDNPAMPAAAKKVVSKLMAGRNVWSAERTDATPSQPLLASTGTLLTHLLPTPGTKVAFKQSSREVLESAKSKHDKVLRSRLEGSHFKHNYGTLGWAALIAVGFGALAFALSGGAGAPLIILICGLMLATLIAFMILIPAPTREGRRLLDGIEGLRLYLRVAERDELKNLPGPEQPPALDAERYERLLPYAVALDVEEAWTRKFTLAVGAAAAAATTAGIAWYRGGSFNSIGDLSKAVGSSLNSSIASASTPPGSSSGSGGGGSSGGGGGGGGGGGR